MDRMALFRSVLVFLAAAFQFAAGFSPSLFEVERSVGEAVEPYRTALVPAGWAFSIWAVLFSLLLIFAVCHALRRNDGRMARAGWLIAGAMTANGAFAIVQPLLGPGWESFALLEISLVLSILAAIALLPERETARVYRISFLAVAALAGWLTVATPAGLSIGLRFEGLVPGGEVGLLTDLGILVLFTAIVPFLARALAAWAYALPILWGLFAVGMAGRLPEAAFAVLGLTSALIILATFRAKRAG
jgi:hypothetical protein